MRIWVSWSSGKDSAYLLHTLAGDPEVEVAGLVTSLNADADRVAMHAVRRELVGAQAARLGLPLHPVELPEPCPNETYEARMAAALATARTAGVEAVAYGDVHLDDVRAYRERLHAGTGVEPLFPLWRTPTDGLARALLGTGVRAVVTCVDPTRIPRTLVGRAYDEAFLAALPADADPCGEHGEFHTFVWDGPGFTAPIAVEAGEVVERGGFVFCDVRPGAASTRGRDATAKPSA